MVREMMIALHFELLKPNPGHSARASSSRRNLMKFSRQPSMILHVAVNMRSFSSRYIKALEAIKDLVKTRVSGSFVVATAYSYARMPIYATASKT